MSIETLLEQMQREIDKLNRRVEDLESSEYNRMNTLYLTDGVTAPSTLSGWGIIFIDTSDGDLKIEFGDGTTKTIVVDT